VLDEYEVEQLIGPPAYRQHAMNGQAVHRAAPPSASPESETDRQSEPITGEQNSPITKAP
jgi:hypothetical protein